MSSVEELFSLLDSDGDGQITRSDILAICDKLELEEGAEAFLSKLGLTDEYRCVSKSSKHVVVVNMLFTVAEIWVFEYSILMHLRLLIFL